MSSELYRERIEVTLDGRQIFYLFLGGALLAALVFVLGVMIGRRVESRSHLVAAALGPEQDPLAALDRMQQDDLKFRRALRDNAAVSAPVPLAAKPVAAGRGGESAGAVATGPKASSAVPAAASAPPPSVPVASAAPSGSVTASSPAVAAAAATTKPTGKYHTLRVASFKDAVEAEAYMQELRQKGQTPHTVEALVDGEKFLRVCLGRYASYDEAVAAKLAYEKKNNKIAYVLSIVP